MRLWDFALFLFHMQSVCVAKFAATTVSLADYCIYLLQPGRFYNLQTLKADTTRARRTSPGLYRIANISSSCCLLPLSPQMCAGRNKQRRPDGPSSARWHSQGSGVRVSEWTCINWSKRRYNKNHQEWWCYFDMLYIHILNYFDMFWLISALHQVCITSWCQTRKDQSPDAWNGAPLPVCSFPDRKIRLLLQCSNLLP